MNDNLSIDRTHASALLAAWRAQMSISAEEAARVLDLDPATYQRLEDGDEDMPLAIWRRCVAFANGQSPEQVTVSLPRDRWVRLVENATAYLGDDHHISRLIQQERWEEVSDFMDFMRNGPHMDLAITDPGLFRRLREAGTKAFLSGLMHFRGPARPFPEKSLRRTPEGDPEREALKKLRPNP